MWFHVQAAGRLIARRRGPVLRMVLVALVASTWCIAGGMWALGTWREADARASSMTIDIVCVDDTTGVAIRELSNTLSRKQGVVEARLLSSDAVWQEFAREMKIVDENLRTVADFPSIVRVRLAPDYVTTERVDRIAADIRATSKGAISSITWSRSYVAMVEELRRTLVVFGGAAGVVSLILFGVAISYAFKAEVHRAGTDLRVAEVLGASMQWIAAPHLLVGLLSGATGLLLSVVMIISLHASSQHLAPWIGLVGVHEVGYAAGALALIGAVVSWIQSLLAVREAMRRR